MLKPLDFEKFSKNDLIPQAIIRRPLSYFQERGLGFTHNQDDLDELDAAAFSLDDKLFFALMHHRGYPKDTTELCLTRSFGENLDNISAAIRAILAQFQLEPDALEWERRMDPDL
jgi:hypothetical protein